MISISLQKERRLKAPEWNNSAKAPFIRMVIARFAEQAMTINILIRKKPHFFRPAFSSWLIFAVSLKMTL